MSDQTACGAGAPGWDHCRVLTECQAWASDETGGELAPRLVALAGRHLTLAEMALVETLEARACAAREATVLSEWYTHAVTAAALTHRMEARTVRTLNRAAQDVASGVVRLAGELAAAGVPLIHAVEGLPPALALRHAEWVWAEDESLQLQRASNVAQVRASKARENHNDARSVCAGLITASASARSRLCAAVDALMAESRRADPLAGHSS